MQPDRPWIHVHTLGQFEYCPNAGVIAFCRQGEMEPEEEDRIVNLSYLPPLDHARHVERAKELGASLKELLLASGLMLVFIWLVALFISLWLSFLLLLCMTIQVSKLVKQSIEYFDVWLKLIDYQRQPPIELPKAGKEAIPIHWWSIVKSDYAPIMPKQSYSDNERHLSGRPWRLMVHRDSRRLLPVIKRSGSDEELKVRSSHRVRLAAYAHLLELEGDVVADWGILIDSKTLSGFAVPIKQVDRERALRLLAELQSMLAASRGSYSMEIPPQNACNHCWLGKPRRYRPGESETKIQDKVVPLYTGTSSYSSSTIEIESILSDSQPIYHCHYFEEGEHDSDDDSDIDSDDSWVHDNDTYRSDSRDNQVDSRTRHSDCGDIFRWRPAHSDWQDQRNT